MRLPSARLSSTDRSMRARPGAGVQRSVPCAAPLRSALEKASERQLRAAIAPSAWRSQSMRPFRRVEREARLGEHLRQLDLGLARGELQRALRFARLERAARPAKPGRPSRGRRASSLKRLRAVKLRRRVERAAPLQARVGEPAARRELAQHAGELRRHRQRLDQARRWPRGRSGWRRARRRACGRQTIWKSVRGIAGPRSITSARSRPESSTPSSQRRGRARGRCSDTSSSGVELVAQARAHRRRAPGRRCPRVTRPFLERRPHAQRALPLAHVDRVVDPRRATRRGRCSRARRTRGRSRPSGR